MWLGDKATEATRQLSRIIAEQGLSLYDKTASGAKKMAPVLASGAAMGAGATVKGLQIVVPKASGALQVIVGGSLRLLWNSGSWVIQKGIPAAISAGASAA